MRPDWVPGKELLPSGLRLVTGRRRDGLTSFTRTAYTCSPMATPSSNSRLKAVRWLPSGLDICRGGGWRA